MENLRNADGEILESYDNRAVIKTLEDLGYKHQGWTVGYSTMSQIRWLSVLDLKDKSEDQLLKEMDYQTRRNIKNVWNGRKSKNATYGWNGYVLWIIPNGRRKHGFKFRDKPYFYEMQKTYKDHAMLKLAYIDLKDYLSTLQQKHDSLIEQLAEVDAVLEENPNSKKNKTSAHKYSNKLIVMNVN